LKKRRITALLAVSLLLFAFCSGEKGNTPTSRIGENEEEPSLQKATVPLASGEDQSVEIPQPDVNIGNRSNSPPEIRSVKFVPEVFRKGDSLGVEVSGIDSDGDDVIYEYTWEKNGTPAGTTNRIEGTLKRNDGITVTITPFDGEARGRSVTLRREIRNVPPSIEGVREVHLEGDTYTCRVLAVDADDDPLTYVLKDAPSGMSIDGSTGTIRWEIPSGFHGKVPATVSVSDGSGGNASYTMVVTVREETAPQALQKDREPSEPHQEAISDQRR
jgi:hypothetical protein